MLIKGLLAFFVFTFSFLNVPAQPQNGTKISGRVLDNNMPLNNTVVYLLNPADSSLIKTVITNTNGFYVFENQTSGNYIINVKLIGFQNSFTPISVKNTVSFTVPDIKLTALSKELQQVEITDKKPFAEIKTGKTILNIENSVIAAGSDAFEILQRSPGVQLNEGGRISMRAKEGVILAVDGKTLNLSSAEIIDYLKNTNADNIAQIELITNPSARYDAAGGAGVINIKMKKGKANGTNFSLASGVGYGDNLKYNSTLNFNTRTTKLNFFGGYSHTYNKRPEEILLNRRAIFNPRVTDYAIINNDLKTRKNNNLRLGADVFITPEHVLGFTATANYNDFFSDEQNNTRIRNNSFLDSVINTNSDETRNLKDLLLNVNYKATLFKNTDFNTDFGYYLFDRTSNELLDYTYLNRQNQPYKPVDRLSNQTPSKIDIKAFRFSFLQPLSKTYNLDFGAKFSKVNANNERNFNLLSNTRPNFLNFGNRNFNYDETINAGYISLLNEGEKSGFTISIRAEQTIAKGTSQNLENPVNRNYTNIFPALEVYKNIGKNHKLTAYAYRRIGRPSYQDLNPFLYFLDQFTYQIGNPNLQPEYTNTIGLSHTFKEDIVTSFEYTLVKDVFYDIAFQDDETGIYQRTSRNFDKQTIFLLSIDAPYDFTEWWNAALNLQGSIEKVFYKTTDFDLAAGSPYLTGGLRQTFSLPKDFNVEVNSNYSSRFVNGIYTYKSNANIDFGLGKSFSKGAANLRFSVSDVFNTRFATRYFTNFTNLDVNLDSKFESRIARLNFTYRFGKATVKAARKRDTATDDEKQRVGN